MLSDGYLGVSGFDSACGSLQPMNTWGICTRRAGKVYKARSRLYRSQILQVNLRGKALDEIYKICMLLHRSDLNISENFRQTFFAFFGQNFPRPKKFPQKRNF